MVANPPNEAERLAALRDLRVLGSAPEPHFDAVCRTAAALFEVPIALVSLVDADHQWFKARCDLAGAFALDGTPRDVAFCAHAILSDEVLVVEDAARDPRFSASPLVTGAPHARFYAGAPLILRAGLRVGTLCLYDIVPRRFLAEQRHRLQDLAEIVVAHLRLHEASAARAREIANQQAAILGQLAEGVIVTDGDGRITFVNDAAAAIHGVARLDVEPDAYSDTYHLFTEDGRPYIPLDLPLARAVRGETVRDSRWRIRRPDGAEVVAIGSARPLRESDGRRIGAVLTLRDDTAREAAERGLRELNATLGERVAERTREADAARAQAEAASRAKSEFLAAMSHEIRTPLSGILGYTDLLLEEPSIDAAIRRHGERIRSAGAALLTIVDDILDFSRVEAGRIDLAHEPFAPAALADEAVSIVRASAAQKGLALRIRSGIEPGSALPARLLGDRDRLRQVLLNLLVNAVKFTRAGGVTLFVDAPVAGALAHLRFAVRDTGIGIPAAKQHLLFERFSQVDGTIRREFGGAGLGLAISKRLVELMGGTIGLRSDEGRGSVFWFEVRLPLAVQAPVEAAPIERTHARTPRRLLLVEDVALNQELACAVLSRGGHRVDVVSSGPEAIEAVRARGYDLVLMDIQMPGMDGISATRLIRALAPPAGDVPVVAMTANVLPHQVASFAAAGMQGHVGKPFRRDVLFAAIERWARAGASAAGAARAATGTSTGCSRP